MAGVEAPLAAASDAELERDAVWDLIERKVLTGGSRISEHWVRGTKRRPLGLLPLSFYPALGVKAALIVACGCCAAYPNPAEDSTFQSANVLRWLLGLVAAGRAASITMNYGAFQFLRKLELGKHKATLERMPEQDGEEASTWWAGLCQSLDFVGLAVSVAPVAFLFLQAKAVFDWPTSILAICFCLDGLLLSPAVLIMKIADALGDHFVAELERCARGCGTDRDDWARFAETYLDVGVGNRGLPTRDDRACHWWPPGDRDFDSQDSRDSLRTLDDHASQMRAPGLISSALLFVAYTLTAMGVKHKTRNPSLLVIIALLAFKFLGQMHAALHKYATRTQRVMSPNSGVYGIVLRRGDTIGQQEVMSMTDGKKIDYQLALYQFEALPVGTTLGGFLITQRLVYVTLVSAYISALYALNSVAGHVF